MRVPPRRDICHLGTIAQLAMGQDQQHLTAARSQFESDFGVFVVASPGETQESRGGESTDWFNNCGERVLDRAAT